MMKLDPDCTRDILLTVEDNVSFSESWRPSSADQRLTKYTPEKILYHVRQCEMSGLLCGVDWYMRGNFSVQDLSPTGHSFLANIREDTNWNKVKQVANEVGSTALDALINIASNIVTNLISGKF